MLQLDATLLSLSLSLPFLVAIPINLHVYIYIIMLYVIYVIHDIVHTTTICISIYKSIYDY